MEQHNWGPRDTVSMLVLGTIWGSSYLFIKLLIDAVNPIAIIGGRMIMGTAVLALILAAQRGRPAPWGLTWFHLTIMAVLGNLIPFWLIAWSQQHTTSALGAILNAAIPLVTLLISALIFRIELITSRRLMGIGVGILGVAALTGPDIINATDASGLGALALLAASACYGFAFAYARRYVRGDPLANVTTQLFIGMLIVLPVVGLFGEVDATKLALSDWLAWVTLSAVGTGLAYVIYYQLIARLGATAASMVTYIIPVVGVILGWLVLGERLSWAGWVGMGLIVVGVWLCAGRSTRRLRPAT